MEMSKPSRGESGGPIVAGKQQFREKKVRTQGINKRGGETNSPSVSVRWREVDEKVNRSPDTNKKRRSKRKETKKNLQVRNRGGV